MQLRSLYFLSRNRLGWCDFLPRFAFLPYPVCPSHLPGVFHLSRDFYGQQESPFCLLMAAYSCFTYSLPSEELATGNWMWCLCHMSGVGAEGSECLACQGAGGFSQNHGTLSCLSSEVPEELIVREMGDGLDASQSRPFPTNSNLGQDFFFF